MRCQHQAAPLYIARCSRCRAAGLLATGLYPVLQVCLAGTLQCAYAAKPHLFFCRCFEAFAGGPAHALWSGALRRGARPCRHKGGS